MKKRLAALSAVALLPLAACGPEEEGGGPGIGITHRGRLGVDFGGFVQPLDGSRPGPGFSLY